MQVSFDYSLYNGIIRNYDDKTNLYTVDFDDFMVCRDIQFAEMNFVPQKNYSQITHNNIFNINYIVITFYNINSINKNIIDLYNNKKIPAHKILIDYMNQFNIDVLILAESKTNDNDIKELKRL